MGGLRKKDTGRFKIIVSFQKRPGYSNKSALSISLAPIITKFTEAQGISELKFKKNKKLSQINTRIYPKISLIFAE